MAWDIIHGAGLQDYYDERTEFAPRPENLRGNWSNVPVQVCDDGNAEVRLMVDGLRCASCVWVAESVLGRSHGVVDATVSYGTGRATIRWDPDETDLETIATRIAALGYSPRLPGEESRPDRDLLTRLGVAVFATMNIMLMYTSLYLGWWGGDIDERFVALFQWLSLALATPVAFYCASPFFAGAVNGLRNRVLHMDLPIAIGVAVLYGHGVAATIGGEHAYLDSMVMLVTLLLGGRILESRGRRRAAEAAASLAATVPGEARKVVGAAVQLVPSDELVVGDRIEIAPGGEVAADGVVATGTGQVRMALITGEAEPIPVTRGDRVVAGAVLLEGAVTVEVTAVGDDSIIQLMATELRKAADRGVRPTSTDRIAPYFTAITLVVAVGTFAYWFDAVGLDIAIANAVAVLVVACPCALALSHPLAAAAGLGAAARRGLLFRSSEALFDLADVDTVVLDKTGTVTSGDLSVWDTDDETLRIAAGLERFSGHPIARAIVAEASSRGIALPRGVDVKEETGVGMSGWVDDSYYVLRSGGPGEVILQNAAGVQSAIRLGDRIRDDAKKFVRSLQEKGIHVALLSGDHVTVARQVARVVGITNVRGRVEPLSKARWIREAQGQYKTVLFAGDGLNDGPALAAADVGIAMGAGAASSILIADGVVSSDALAPIEASFRAARACKQVVRSNQIRSVAYNVAAVTAAVFGLINPLIAAVLMPLSSAVVVWGSSRVEPMVARGK